MAATHKTLFILLTYALLEWILILMLLLNSFFSYLITKFATHYNLKPPCFWCSTIHHLLEPNNNINPYPDLICESHATEILNLYCSLKVTTEPLCRNGKCSSCFQIKTVDRSFDTTSPSTFCGKNEMVQVMDLPVENKSSGHIQVFDQIIPLEWTDSSTSCSTSSNGHESMVFEEQDQVQKQDGKEDKAEEGKAGISIDRLMAELKAERLAVCGLYIELDEERNASAIAAKQAMATITRLEEEKVAVQIESMHNKRMMDEQADYDQEVVQLLNELVMKLENDKVELENEVEMYKKKLLDNSWSMSSKESLDDETDDVLDLKKLRTVEESIWILDELKDLIRKASLDGEDVSYKGNRSMFHLFDHVEGMNMNEEDDEASHSAWKQTSF